MKFVLALLFVLATALAEDDTVPGCSEEDFFECLSPLINIVDADKEDDEEICGVAGNMYHCLLSKVEVCEVDKAEVEDDLAEMKQMISEKCGSDFDEAYKFVDCLQTNGEHVGNCVEDLVSEILGETPISPEEIDEPLKCLYMSKVANCMVERAQEKCGDYGAQLTLDSLVHIPDDTIETCLSHGIEFKK